MTINAANINLSIGLAGDGKRYSRYPNGAGEISASLNAFGWGQSISASGTITGPSPLAVFFDATETTHLNGSISTWRDLGYHFDFGYADPGDPGTWAYSGADKGNQVGGPEAAHVFETPGSYTVTVNVEDADGNFGVAYVNVVVLDADTYWTGGGRTTTNIPVSDGAWPTWANNTRYTLDADGDYASAFPAIAILNKQNIRITKTGSGADPVVHSITVDNNVNATVPTTGARLVFDQLNITTAQVKTPVGGEDALFYRCTMAHAPGGGASTLGRYTAHPDQAWPRPTRIWFQECSIDAGGADIPFFKQMWQFVWQGNLSINSAEHCLRVQGAQYGFIGHNRHYSPGSVAGLKHCLTIRSDGVDDAGQYLVTGAIEPASRYIVLADNYLGETTDNATWLLYIGPQNATSVESLEYIIAERTRYANVSSAPSSWSMTRGCHEITIRDETYDSGATNGVKRQVAYGAAVAADATWDSPDYSTQWNETVDGVYRITTPTGILPPKAS